jgi:hypothetical protein
MQLIGLGYVARSGKDTIADFLCKNHGYMKISFIAKMKEACRLIFGLSTDQLYGHLKEVVDPFWNEHLHLVHQHGIVVPYDQLAPEDKTSSRLEVTPRLIMQLMGTEAGREVFGNDIWVTSTIRELKNSNHDKWIVSDVRFPNEADMILKSGGRVYRVDRPGAGAKGGIAAHPSETALVGYQDWTGVIENNGTLQDLFAKAVTII